MREGHSGILSSTFGLADMDNSYLGDSLIPHQRISCRVPLRLIRCKVLSCHKVAAHRVEIRVL